MATNTVKNLWFGVIICLVGIGIFAYLMISVLTREPDICRNGECLTNVITGERNCSGILVEDLFNKCNPRRSCRQGHLMYDPEIGSATSCPVEYSDEDCKCYEHEFCPDEVTTYFVNTPYSYYGRPINSQTPSTGFQFVMHNNYTHPMLPTVKIRDRPLAISRPSGEHDGVCSIAAINVDLIWPVEGYRQLNRCISGRLVYRNNRYLCKRHPDINDMSCAEPERIIEKEDGTFSCGIPPN